MDELAERRDDEYRSKEDMLREDVRFTFEVNGIFVDNYR